MRALAATLARRSGLNGAGRAAASAGLTRCAAASLAAQPSTSSSSSSLEALVARVAAAAPAPASGPASSGSAPPEPEWEVVRVDATGRPAAVRVTASGLGLAPRDAGLFSRAGGAAGLASPALSNAGWQQQALPAQRATLVSRIVRVHGGGGGGTATTHRGLILLRTEAVRAAIAADEAFIFPSRRDRDTETLLESVRDAVRSAAAAVGSAAPTASAAADGGGTSLSPPPPSPPPSSSSARLPFELAVLEALLAETVRQFERRHRQLRLVADGVADDVRRALRGGGGGRGGRGLLFSGGGDGEDGGSSSSSVGGFASAAAGMSGVDAGAEVGRLLPIQVALQEIRHDVREAAAAVAEVADSDAALASICLSDHDYSNTGGGGGGGRGGKAGGRSLTQSPPPHAHVAAALLEAYERQIETVASAVRELEENTLSLQAALAMGLDAHRNSIMFLNATMTICSLSVAACALPATWFGANLASGLEDAPGVFWPLVAWSAAGAAALGGAIALGWRRWPRAAAAARAADMQGLRDLLLYHLDDMDDILAAAARQARAGGGEGGSGAGGGLSRKAFHSAVRAAVQGRPIAADELDLLFRVYDADRDGFLRAAELSAAAARWPPPQLKEGGRAVVG
jgi:magnesium transporter